MSACGPSRPIAAPQSFGRSRRHSGNREALEREASVANDPRRHFAAVNAAFQRAATVLIWRLRRRRIRSLRRTVILMLPAETPS